MEKGPKTREELIDDLQAAIEESGQDPSVSRYMMRPDNIAKLSNDEIKAYTDSLLTNAKQTKDLHNDVSDQKAGEEYYSDKAKMFKELEDGMDAFIAKGFERIMREREAEKRKKQNGGES